MNKGNTQKLIRDFPELYRHTGKSKEDRLTEFSRTDEYSAFCMQWGFECGDGWFRLIYDLSEAITDIARQAGLEVEARQVKEKFGSLRFYIGVKGENQDAAAQIARLVDMAEERSKETCEFCGLLGEMREGGWRHVACDQCEAKYQA